MYSVAEILRHDKAKLGVALDLSALDARFEAQLLMAQALQVNRAWLIAHGDEAPPLAAFARYQNLLERRLQGEPMAYIFGEKEFYGITLSVNPAVLIPRPETELLVDLVLAQLPINRPCRILDLGTGSGAIAISLASLRPRAQIVAVDNSMAALQVAQANAHRLGLTNLDFICSDWWQAVPPTPLFDIIVSNPPYIARQDPHLQQGDLRFEPVTALAAEEQGLADLRNIISLAPHYLTKSGMLWLEHGYDQGERVRKLLIETGFDSVTTHLDLGGMERVSEGQFR